MAPQPIRTTRIASVEAQGVEDGRRRTAGLADFTRRTDGRCGGLDRDRLVASAAALVLPSRSPETFGLVGLEAFRFGTPVVASNVGGWDLTTEQAAKLRDYLERGGFLLCDSFFGTQEWQTFEAALRKVFPDRPVVELAATDPIFTTFYDLSQRKQVRNMRSIRRAGLDRGYRADGSVPHWRAILDDDGRVMVMISFNNDLGDSWQYADDPQYPQEDSNLGIRLAVNFAIYDLTH